MKPKKHTQLQTVCHYTKWKGSKLLKKFQHPLQTICNMSEDVQYKRECAVLIRYIFGMSKDMKCMQVDHQVWCRGTRTTKNAFH